MEGILKKEEDEDEEVDLDFFRQQRRRILRAAFGNEFTLGLWQIR